MVKEVFRSLTWVKVEIPQFKKYSTSSKSPEFNFNYFLTINTNVTHYAKWPLSYISYCVVFKQLFDLELI